MYNNPSLVSKRVSNSNRFHHPDVEIIHAVIGWGGVYCYVTQSASSIITNFDLSADGSLFVIPADCKTKIEEGSLAPLSVNYLFITFTCRHSLFLYLIRLHMPYRASFVHDSRDLVSFIINDTSLEPSHSSPSNHGSLHHSGQHQFCVPPNNNII
jgi:hypothetical protein